MRIFIHISLLCLVLLCGASLLSAENQSKPQRAKTKPPVNRWMTPIRPPQAAPKKPAKLQIQRLLVGGFTNTYIVGNQQEVMVIDPGFEGARIAKAVGKRKLRYILMTHGHFDHILALPYLKQKFPTAKVGIHPKDKIFLNDPAFNLSTKWGRPPFSWKGKVDISLTNKKSFSFASWDVHVLHTPGHTPGSVCLKIGKHLFSGDTLFRHSVGRTDLPGGSISLLRKSLRQQLLPLLGPFQIYPGHGRGTTLAHEKATNRFMR